MSWLRPENVIWDAVAAKMIYHELRESKDLLEVGIGNGYCTFMILGGKFKKEYDYYYNVNTKGFWDNKDIYDHVTSYNIKQYILKYPENRVKYALDHKSNLLEQTKQLGFVDQLILQNANDVIDFDGVSTIYSNIIYWLADPIKVIKNFDHLLKKGGKIILVFPNNKFYQYAISYGRKNKLQVLLNRGRADSMMWSMDMEDFAKIIQEHTGLSITKYQKYLAETTLKIWDIGLRPISPHLINMANYLNEKTRMEIKDEWCATILKFLEELLPIELDSGPKEGGFNFVVLEK